MLRKALCCVLTLAAAAVAQPIYSWVPLEATPSTPDCPVGQGSLITYGADSIWGIFPNANDGKTYVSRYGPLSTHQQIPPTGHWLNTVPIPFGANSLYFTGLTFQWQQGSALYVIGASNVAGDATLYWYSVDGQTWGHDPITEFTLGDGASIVFVPNRQYGLNGNQVPGYIYCLSGGSKDFWYYSIPLTVCTPVQGIFPPDSSTIANQKPLFQWNSGSDQYRLQVSTDLLFGATVIDTIIYAAEFQTTAELANATYYWRIGTPDGLNWIWGNTHSFVLLGGFVNLYSPIPDDNNVGVGAALAYEGDPWCWNGAQSILATVGGGSVHFYKYDVLSNTWMSRADTPYPPGQNAGTSLTTNDPTQEYGQWPAGAFGGPTMQDNWFYPYQADGDYWVRDAQFEAFPQPLGAGACFVMGRRPWDYLTTGELNGSPTHYFYAIEPRHIETHPHHGADSTEEGSQAGYICAGGTRARVITYNRRIEVEYQLPAAAYVRATLHDAVGRKVGVLDAGIQQPGPHRLTWNHSQDGRTVSAGAYFLLLDMGSGVVCLKSIMR